MVVAKPKRKSIMWRITHNRAVRMILPPSGVAARWGGAMTLFVIGISRLGLLPTSVLPTIIPYRVYGFTMLIACFTLFFTMHRRLAWYGRLAAVFGFAILGGFAIDILPAYTSSLIVAIPTLLLLGEVGVIDEC